MTLAPDFDEFCGLLIDRSAEFAIIGAHALAFHGAPRFTGDLDILVRPTVDNARRVLAAIAAFGFPTHPVTPEDIESDARSSRWASPPYRFTSGVASTE